MPTDVELYMSPALPALGFDEAPPDLVDPAGDPDVKTWGPIIRLNWTPFRFRLVEGISEMPRLELLMARYEPNRDPGDAGDDGVSFFDRIKQRADNVRGANNALDGALTQLQNDWAAGNYGAVPGDALAVGNQGMNVINQGVQGITQTATDTANTFGSWQQVQEDILGLGSGAGPWPGNPPPSPLEFLGTTRSIRFARQDAASKAYVHGRWFTGVVSEFEDLGNLLTGWRAVSIVIVPSLYKLSLRKDCRIFQDVDAETILRDVLSRAGLYAASLDIRLPAPLPKREYCVQWNETDLAFFQRILEEEGLVYWFEHRKGAEKLVIADGTLVGDPRFNALDALGSFSSTLPHRPTPTQQGARNDEQTWSFRLSKRLVPKKTSLRDFSFSEPRSYVRNESDSAPELYEMAEYELRPALVPPVDPEYVYKQVEPARKAALHRLDAIVSGEVTARGESNAVAMAPGLFVDVVEDRGASPPFSGGDLTTQRTYLVTRVEHHGFTNPNAVGAGLSAATVPFARGYTPPGGLEYGNRYTAVPAMPGSVRFRVLPMVPRPRIPGVQTAIVLGPDTTDPVEATDRRQVDWIHTDPLGRIQVRFHWDRRADVEQPDAYVRGRSAWLRVAMPWAGDGYGVSFVPRANMEVVVGFENGDPDRPVVIGTVHNRRNPFPVERKHIDHAKPNVLGEKPSPDDERLYYKEDGTAEQHQAKPTRDLNMIRTRSHKGTSSNEFRADGYNEISFHDASGSERIRIHAELDLVEDVEHDHVTVVQNDQLNVVGTDHDEKIGECSGLKPSDDAPAADVGTEPKGNQTLEVGNVRRKIVEGHEKTTVEKDRTTKVLGSETLVVHRDRTETVKGEETVKVGVNSPETRHLTVNGHRKTEVSGNDQLDVMVDQTVTVGGAFSMSGATVSMVVTTPPGAPPGPSMTVDEDGNQKIESKGEPGTIRLTAHGGDPEQPESTTGTVEVLAQRNLLVESKAPSPPAGVRLECGDDLWLEIGPEGISMKAPKRVLLACGASTLQVEHAGDHERIVLSTRTDQGEPKGFYLSLKGGGAGDAPVVNDDAAAETIENKEEIDLTGKAEDGVIVTERTIRGDDVGYVEPGTELPDEPGEDETWSMPGIIMTADNIEIAGGGVMVTSQKGVNIQEKEAGEWATTRLLSKSERDVIEALEGARRDLEAMETELEQKRPAYEEKKAAYEEQSDITEQKRLAAFGSGGTDEKWRKTCRDLQNAEEARKAAEVRYQERKEDYDEAKEEGVIEDEDWKFDEAKRELEKAEERVKAAKEAEREAYEEHKKAREDLGAEEQKLAEKKKEHDDAKREIDDLEKRIELQKHMVDMFEDEAAKRTAPRTNG